MKLRQGFAGLFVVTVVLSGCTVTTTPYGVAVGPAPVVVAPAPPPPGAPPPVAPAPGVVVEPEYYIWDGYEYVGWYNGAWLYWNGGVWLGCPPFILGRFYSWQRWHPGWQHGAFRYQHGFAPHRR